MSANMVPEYDESNPFVRLADTWYGQATGRGENPNVFFGGVGGWQPGMGSRFDPTREVGYFRFNTGNPTRDAIFSIAFNELGVDNFVRAVQNLDEKNYWGAGRESALAAASAVLIGGGTLARAVVGSRVVGALPGAISRTAPLPTRQAFVVGSRGAGTTAVGETGRRTLPQRAGNIVRDIRGQGLGRAPIPATARFAGLRRAGRRLGRIGALGLLGLTAYEAMTGRPAPSAAEARIAAGEALPGDVPQETVDFVPRTEEAEAATQARIDIAGIQQQYGNILRELQGMYQLSETEEERERLRFMLADIEAQRDAGLQAIADGYSETVAQIRERAILSAEGSTERAARYGTEIREGTDRAAQRMILQNLQQQQQFRGLGSGSDQPVNEWVGLMSAMAPAQQQYTQRMGDITTEGINWLADTVSAQGQAQAADLQRLAAATRSGTIARQQQQVSDRINRERELERAAILDTLQRQASAVQSAQQFNAGEAGTSRADMILDLAANFNLGPNGIQNYFLTRNLPGLTQQEIDFVNSVLGSPGSIQGSATTPVGP